jgi:hypothetical protein
MTFELTSDRLQAIAVDCVTKFISKEASLSDAIAKEAQFLELNSEQTKRVIETTNTLAYLRQLEKSADRTFEFDVADYNKVMAAMCVPDLEKSAGEMPPWLNKDKDDKDNKKDSKKDGDKDDKDKSKKSKDGDEDDENKKSKSKSKEDKDDKNEKSKDSDKDSDEDKQEKKAMLMHGYFVAKNSLEKMAYDEASIYMELSSAAAVIRKGTLGFEKLAEVVQEEDLSKLAKLCGVEKTASEEQVFRDKELVQANYLYGLYKKANDFMEKKAQTEDFIKRAEQLLFHKTANVEKLASNFIGKAVMKIPSAISGAASGLARGLGSTIAGGAAAAGSKVGKTLSQAGGFGRAANAKGFGSTDDAVKAFDKVKRTAGEAAAKAKFGGAKPNLLVHRVGASGALTALSGLSLNHKNNVKDLE